MSAASKVVEFLESKQYDKLIQYVEECAFDGELFSLNEKKTSAAMQLALAYNGASSELKDKLDEAFEGFQSCNTGEDLLAVHPVEGTILHILAEYGSCEALHCLDTYEAYQLDLFTIKRGKDGKTIWEVAQERGDESVRDFFVGEFADVLSLGNIGELLASNDVLGLKRLVDASAERFNRTSEDVGKASRAIDSLVTAPLDAVELCFKLGFLDFFAVPAVAEGFIRKWTLHKLQDASLDRALVTRVLGGLLTRMSRREVLAVHPEEVLALHVYKIEEVRVEIDGEEEQGGDKVAACRRAFLTIVRNACRQASIATKEETAANPLRTVMSQLAFGTSVESIVAAAKDLVESHQDLIKSLELAVDEEGQLPRSHALGIAPYALAAVNVNGDAVAKELLAALETANLVSATVNFQKTPRFAGMPTAEDDDGASDLYLDEDASDLEEGEFDENAGQDVQVGQFLSVDVLNKWAQGAQGADDEDGDDLHFGGDDDEEEEQGVAAIADRIAQYYV